MHRRDFLKNTAFATAATTGAVMGIGAMTDVVASPAIMQSAGTSQLAPPGQTDDQEKLEMGNGEGRFVCDGQI